MIEQDFCFLFIDWKRKSCLAKTRKPTVKTHTKGGENALFTAEMQELSKTP